MRVLLNPVSRAGEGIRWPYVAYTTVMFSFATIYTAMGLDVQSLSFIDNRNVPRIDGSLTSGPIGYQSLIESEAIHVVPDVIFLLNDLLSDGLLVSPTWDRDAGRLTQLTIAALSLLHFLRHKLLGHHPPMLDVPRLSRCVSFNRRLTIVLSVKSVIQR